MSAAWVLYVLLVGALLSVAANAIEGAVRRAQLPVRWVWAAALAGLVVLAFAAPFRQQQRVVPLEIPTLETTTPAPSQPKIELASTWQQILYRAEAIQRESGRLLNASVSPRISRVFVSTWIGASGLIALLVIVVSGMMARRRKAWPRAELHGATVRVSGDIGPAVVGFSAPEIVVPGWLLGRSDDEQRLAVTHEREHMLARDHLLLAGGWTVVALLPWNPASWWMLSRMRLAIELDCDARVLRRGVAARSYGQMLIDIADHCNGQRALSLALADHTSHLERRLLAMKRTRTRFGRTQATVLGVIGALAVVAACESALPTSAEVQTADVAALEKKAVFATIRDRGTALKQYIIDDKVATAEQAHALKAGDIVSMNIIQGGKKVLVTTKMGYAEKSVNGELLERKVMADSLRQRKMMMLPDMVPTTKSVELRSKKDFDGILLINGKRVALSELDILKNSVDRIESVEVIKGESAQRMYPGDAAAQNGVISIKTKP
jgi:beta-lactamase regulating signal transducer with metallopeptidase domain